MDSIPLLDKWNFFLKDLESPQVFIDWTLIWGVSSALQRRCWYGNYLYDPLFFNIYVLFVANPGIGKSRAARIIGSKILKTFRHLDPQKVANGFPLDKQWTDDISFSADSTTLESLIQQLNKSTRTIELPLLDVQSGLVVNKKQQQAPLSVLLSEELTSLFKKGNEGVTDFLNQCYDANDYTRITKTQGSEIIKNVCVPLLGCTIPDNMKKLMAMGILQNGFTARAIPIYAAEKRHNKLSLEFSKEQIDAFEEVKNHFKLLLEVKGEVTFAPDAHEWFKDYYETKIDPTKDDSKTKQELDRLNFDKRTDDFYGRWKAHLIKISGLVHYMCNPSTNIITLDELLYARKLLRIIEPDMHKALASAGQNPLFEFYKKVHDACKDIGGSKGLTKIQLKMLFAEDLDDMKLEAVIKYLGEIGKLEYKIINSKGVYLAK